MCINLHSCVLSDQNGMIGQAHSLSLSCAWPVADILQITSGFCQLWDSKHDLCAQKVPASVLLRDPGSQRRPNSLLASITKEHKVAKYKSSFTAFFPQKYLKFHLHSCQLSYIESDHLDWVCQVTSLLWLSLPTGEMPWGPVHRRQQQAFKLWYHQWTRWQIFSSQAGLCGS